MGNVVNLNKFRKQKAKAEASKRADANRRLHGRTKGERVGEARKKHALEAKLDGARLERDDDQGGQERAPEPEREQDSHQVTDES